MDKSQALQTFWESFGVPAYDENSVPDDAPNKRITYASVTGNIEQMNVLTASLWDLSTSWEWISQKVEEIADYIGNGGTSLEIDKGYIYFSIGTPFAQRMGDPENDLIRRYYIQVDVQYLTAT